eukprot:1297022-Amphidinium_carterae.2
MDLGGQAATKTYGKRALGGWYHLRQSSVSVQMACWLSRAASTTQEEAVSCEVAALPCLPCVFSWGTSCDAFGVDMRSVDAEARVPKIEQLTLKAAGCSSSIFLGTSFFAFIRKLL